ncbi:hypothetical protein ABF176_002533, partial [Flavobacterium psychrophilum]
YILIENFFEKSDEIDLYILKENLKSKNLENNGFLEVINPSEGYRILLQNIETKQYFVCKYSFLYEYEKTKSDVELKKFNDGYIAWKTKYNELTKSGTINMNNCNAITKKYSFVNVFGNTVLNASKIPKQEKVIFNNNYDKINEKLLEIGILERERDFLGKFVDNVKENEGLDVYKLSLYVSNVSKLNIE